MQLFLDGLYRCQSEVFPMNMSRYSCRKLCPVPVSYCCDVPEQIVISGVLYGTMVRQPFIWCPITHEVFDSMESVATKDLEGTLRARESKGILWVRLVKL